MSKRSKAEERAAKAAAALAERKRKERRRNTITVLSVVGAIVLIVAIGFVINQARDDDAAGAADDRRPSTTCPSATRTRRTSIVIYEDFLCPVCQAFEAARRTSSPRPRRPATCTSATARSTCFQDDDREGLLGGRRRGVRRGAGGVRARGGQGVPRPALREPAVGGRAVPRATTVSSKLAVQAGAPRTTSARASRAAPATTGSCGHRRGGRARRQQHPDDPAGRRGVPATAGRWRSSRTIWLRGAVDPWHHPVG